MNPFFLMKLKCNTIFIASSMITSIMMMLILFKVMMPVSIFICAKPKYTHLEKKERKINKKINKQINYNQITFILNINVNIDICM